MGVGIAVDDLVGQRWVLYFLAWAFSITGAALIGVLVFLAKGVYGKLREMGYTSDRQFKEFGQQLNTVKDLVTEDIHRHDVRITRLEEWRKGFETRVLAKND